MNAIKGFIWTIAFALWLAIEVAMGRDDDNWPPLVPV